MENLKFILAEKGITPYKIEKNTKVSEGTIRGWLKGRMPRMDNLYKVCEFLDVHPDIMLRGNLKLAESLNKNILQVSDKISQYLARHPEEIPKISEIVKAITKENGGNIIIQKRGKKQKSA